MNAKKQKDHIKNVYSKYWIKASTDIYGFGKYEQGIVNLIYSLKQNLRGNKILESCIGTGYPFAAELSKRGFDVYGVDLSESLIKECRRKYGISSIVADGEKLPFRNGCFDLTYCILSILPWDN